MPAFATSAEFLSRIDARYVEDLVAGDATAAEVRVTRALEDASDELRAYQPRIPARFWPAAATLRVHAIKVAIYNLTLDRPGKEFEQIRNAYNDVIAFYTGLIAEAANASANATPTGGKACRPPSVFNDQTLKRFV